MLASAGVTEELHDILEHPQRNAVHELTEIVTQGRLDIHTWSILARKEYEVATAETRALREECGATSTNQDSLRVEMVGLYNRLRRLETGEQEFEARLGSELISADVTLQLQLTDVVLEVKQEPRTTLEHQVLSEQLAKDLLEAREQNNITNSEFYKLEQDHDFHRLATQQQVRTLQQSFTNVGGAAAPHHP